MPKEILLATRNLDKIKELSLLLDDDVIIHQAGEFSNEEVEESGASLGENAMLKAKNGFYHSGLPTVADDTGLEVDALNGAPGVHSSRYAGNNASYDDNVNKLLEVIINVPDAQRTARFRTVIAYVDQNRVERFEGVLEGRILREKRGENGFGYDPVFLPGGSEKTLAELPTAQKNQISHRGKAFQAFIRWWKEVKGNQ